MNSHQRYLMTQKIARISLEAGNLAETLWKTSSEYYGEQTAGSDHAKLNMLLYKLNEAIHGINELRQILQESDPRPSVDEIEFTANDIRVSEPYRQKVRESIDGHLDWMENALNGKLQGKEYYKPLLYEGSKFHLIIRPVEFSEEVRDKFKDKLNDQ